MADPASVIVHRDKLRWGHRKGLEYEKHPELLSVLVDTGEGGTQQFQVCPYSSSVEIRDHNGSVVTIELFAVPALVKALREVAGKIAEAEA